MARVYQPNFKTQEAEFSKADKSKIEHGLTGPLQQEIRDFSQQGLSWEAEQIAKSHGVYLEFNRAKKGTEKDFMYMVRISNPGGGPISREQYKLMDELSDKYTTDPEGRPSLRFTTRQNIQFHWVKKQSLVDLIKTLAEAGKRSLNGCGDNTRNVMGCPLSRFSNIFNAHVWAQRVGDYFQLPVAPYIQIFELDPNYVRQPETSFRYARNLLNRKFKIAFPGIHPNPETGKLEHDNCVEMLTNDMSVLPVLENGSVVAFQIYVGGGQGEKNGEPTMATLGRPVCTTDEKNLLAVLDAAVHVHEEWGDRANRQWARVKYVIREKGTDWYRQRMSERLGYSLEKPNSALDIGRRWLHHGWQKQESNGLWAYGCFIENGRVSDYSPNGKLKTMVRTLMDRFPVELMVTTNQDLLFTNIPDESRADFERTLSSHGYGLRNGKPYSKLRLISGSCVGRDTCKLAYTDSEKFEPGLIDELEKLGWSDLAESVGVTGCEAQCFRPATKSIGVVGSGLNVYQIKLGGDEAARNQGRPIIASTDKSKMYLRQVPRDRVASVIDAIFRFYLNHRQNGEDLGTFFRSYGVDSLIGFLNADEKTADLMKKTFHTDWVLDK